MILVLGAANRPLRAREIHAAAQQLAGQPLSWSVTGGNRNDVTPLVERTPPVGGKVGRPRRRPDRVAADRGYDHDKTADGTLVVLPVGADDALMSSLLTLTDVMGTGHHAAS